jgi:hypothetical protein
MADDRQSSPPSQLQNAVSPPAEYVTLTHVSATVAEITMVLGRIRALIDQNSNVVRPNVAIEWFRSLSYNPIAAKQLHLVLGVAIEFYEKQYGKIPEDPNFRLPSLPD